MQSLSSIYGQAWPESLCGVRLGTGPLERIVDGLKEEPYGEGSRKSGMAVTLHLEWRLRQDQFRLYRLPSGETKNARYICDLFFDDSSGER